MGLPKRRGRTKLVDSGLKRKEDAEGVRRTTEAEEVEGDGEGRERITKATGTFRARGEVRARRAEEDSGPRGICSKTKKKKRFMRQASCGRAVHELS